MRLLRLVALLVAAAVMPAQVWGQQTESRISGRVIDSSQAPLPGVTVTVTDTETGRVRTAVSDEEGGYVITNLSPGHYLVQVELDGFQKKTRDVVLGVSQFERADIELSVAAISEHVNVSAAAPVLDTASARIGVNVSPE